MADNVAVTEGSGKTIASADVGGFQFQKILVANAAGTVIDPIAQVAHDAADSGAPIKVGFKAVGSLSAETLVTDNDRVNSVAGLDGAQYVRTVPLEDVVSGNVSNTDGTLTEVIAAAAAGIKQYLTRISLSNSHASTVAIVDIKSATTIRWTVAVPPGGREIAFDPPLAPNAAAENWSFDPQAAVTTLYCAMNGFKSKV